MERYRVIGSVDNFDGQQNLDEWIQMIERAAEFAGWTPEQSFKAALFRLRGEASEYAEQLRDEGKLTSWKGLKQALKERYENAGKEQWHQYLLNTATQGNSTVQEWAQTVRKLSLKALGSAGTQLKREEEGQQAGEQAGGQQAEQQAGEAEPQDAGNAGSEARKKLLDFMRKSNFTRGLRSSLRKMVWRNKCETFDEAVRAAAEEEAVEASHREEEVLSCYKRDLPSFTAPGLVDQIVSALEIREEAKQKGHEAVKNDKEGTIRTEPRTLKVGDAAQAPALGADEEPRYHTMDEDEHIGAPSGDRHYYRGPAANRGHPNPARPQYGEQLPLPRNRGPRPGMRQEWTRQGWGGDGGRVRTTYHNRAQGPVCYSCGGRGHVRRECPTPSYQQPGNGSRRLQ